MRLSGEIQAGSQAVQNGLKEQGKEMIWGFMVGGAGMRIPVYGSGLVWFELPAGTKGGYVWTFLSVFSDVGQQWKGYYRV